MQNIFQKGTAEIAYLLQRLDVTANNLANINTTSYKAQKIDFGDFIVPSPQTQDEGSEVAVKVARTSRDFSRGVITRSDNPYSLAINGEGFFQLEDENGNKYYTRDGNFLINAGGQLVNRAGHFLPDITIPGDIKELRVYSNGTVEAVNFQEETSQLGQIRLYTFNAPQKLKAIGNNMFVPDEQNQEPGEHIPGDPGVGELKQGFLERSNADMVAEMIKLLQTQRAVQFNAQSVTKTADRLWEMANNLRR